MQCLHRPRLTDGILSAQKKRRLAVDGVAQILELEPVGVDRVELDPLDAVVATQLDHGLIAMPWVIEEERSLGADGLELVAFRQTRPAVEERVDISCEAHRAREHPVRAARADVRLTEDRLGLACEEARTEQLGAVLAAVPERWRLFFGFLAESGLRIGEAVELRWRDIDLGTGWLSIERRLYRGRVGLPKGRETRRVRLSQRMTRELWNLRKETKAGDDDVVFTGEQGGSVEQSNVMTRVLKPAAVAAGLGEWVKTKKGRRADTWVGFHTFRHTCATMLFRAGWNAPQVQRHLGHSDAGFTMRRYVHRLDADVPEPDVLDALDAVAGGNTAVTREAEMGRDADVTAAAGTA